VLRSPDNFVVWRRTDCVLCLADNDDGDDDDMHACMCVVSRVCICRLRRWLCGLRLIMYERVYVYVCVCMCTYVFVLFPFFINSALTSRGVSFFHSALLVYTCLYFKPLLFWRLNRGVI